MDNTVIILGAGASAHTGAPLMNDFIDKADVIRNKASDPHFDLVFEALHELSITSAKAAIDIDNVESVFGAFETACIINKLGGLSSESIKLLPNAMRHVIVRTLTNSMPFKFAEDGSPLVTPYTNFLDGVTKIKTDHGCDVSVISFNYDLAIDYAVYTTGHNCNYALNGSFTSDIPVLKLHGSLNWGACVVCNQIRAVPMKEIMRDFSINPHFLKYHNHSINIDCNQIFKNLLCCDKPIRSLPVIIPPTWYKTQYHSQLTKVWEAAADCLGSAENILVYGYSLPPTDQFFRHLYALGVAGRSRLKRFWVFDPCSDVENTYRQLLASNVERKFQYFQNDFLSASKMLRRHGLNIRG